MSASILVQKINSPVRQSKPLFKVESNLCDLPFSEQRKVTNAHCEMLRRARQMWGVCDVVTRKSDDPSAQSFSATYATAYTLDIQAVTSSIQASRDLPR